MTLFDIDWKTRADRALALRAAKIQRRKDMRVVFKAARAVGLSMRHAARAARAATDGGIL